MEENAFPAAERILNDIKSVFKKDSKLKDFQILPVTVNENKSPVHHVEHSLGLESWCVPHVYCYAYNLLMDIRQHKRRRQDSERIDKLLMGALLLNPDVTVLWNMRRDLPDLEPQFELHFTAVVLTRKPKSAEIFNYRKWLINKLLDVHPEELELLTSEVHACQLAAERYPNNYYAWSHRIWCLNQLPCQSGTYVSFLVDEWIQSREWVSTHVSDHSGFHYRQQLLQRFVNLSLSCYSVVRKCTTDIEKSSLLALQTFLSPESRPDSQLTEETKSMVREAFSNHCEKVESIPLGLVLSELFYNTDLIVVFPGHEAVWYHRRFVLVCFQEFASSLRGQIGSENNCHKDNNGVSLEKTKRVECISDSLMKRVVQFETVLYSRTKSSKDRQANCVEKHRAWLASIMKINIHLT